MGADSRKQRIAIVERDPFIAEMEASTLNAEGYDAKPISIQDGIEEELAKLNPDLIVLDLYPLTEHPYKILDDLRSNPTTQAIPVLAVSTIEPVAQNALASYNVRVTLEKPFWLEDFLAKVREALNQPPLRAGVPWPSEKVRGDLVDQAAAIVARYSRDALFRWVQRLQSEPPWQGRTDLDLGRVLDEVPVLVEVLGIALQYRSANEPFTRQAESVERVCSHAILRKRQGFSLSDLIREYSLLRGALLTMLERHLPTEIHTADLFAVVRLVDGTMDEIIEITVPAYVSPFSSQTSEMPQAA